MILLAFHKVGLNEYVAWYRKHNYVISKRGDGWILAFDGRVIKRTTTHADAVDAAHVDIAERKKRGVFNR